MKDRKDLSPEEWATEFHDFVAARPVEPSRVVSLAVRSRILFDLNPTALQVFVKIASLHVFSGMLTLLFCPQFGISPFSEMGLMRFFMNFGDHICMMACGAVFLGTTGMVAGLVLRPEEIRVLKKTRLLQFGVLALASIGVFFFFGTAAALSLAGAWWLGSVLGALLTFEITSRSVVQGSA